MTKARIERWLAAILAADVAGYSRLIGIDEEGTLAALKALRRELIDPKIAEHRGRIDLRQSRRSKAARVRSMLLPMGL
jgi:class 3 adenylate cyclase